MNTWRQWQTVENHRKKGETVPIPQLKEECQAKRSVTESDLAAMARCLVRNAAHREHGTNMTSPLIGRMMKFQLCPMRCALQQLRPHRLPEAMPKRNRSAPTKCALQQLSPHKLPEAMQKRNRSALQSASQWTLSQNSQSRSSRLAARPRPLIPHTR